MTFLLALALACSQSEPPAAGVKLDDFGPVPDFALTDQTTSPVGLAQLRGYVWVADFMFTSCPDVCPTLSARLSGVARRYQDAERLRFVSFSVDPGTDTPAKLADYAARFGAVHPTWRFLTGDVTEMKRIVTDGFKMLMEREPAAADGKAVNVLHGDRFILVDKAAHIRAYADPKVPGELEAAIDLLLAEG